MLSVDLASAPTNGDHGLSYCASVVTRRVQSTVLTFSLLVILIFISSLSGLEVGSRIYLFGIRACTLAVVSESKMAHCVSNET